MSVTLDDLQKKYDKEYDAEIRRIFKKYPNQIRKIYSNPENEFDETFVGFLFSYNTFQIPNDFTVIDFGCNAAVQANYFEKNKKYIGVDVIEKDYRFELANTSHYQMSIQNFIKKVLPDMIEQGLDLNKTFAICSYVPDDEAEKLVADTFKYYRIIYCDVIKSECLPEID